MSTFSPSEAAFEGFRLIKARPASVFVWGLVTVLVLAIVVALIWLLLGPQIQQAFLAGVQGMKNNGTSYRYNFSSGPMAIFIDCAIFRTLLRPSQRSFASLRFSGDELRVFAVSIGLGVISILAIILAVIVAAIPLVILYKSGISGAQPITILLAVILCLVAICLILWIAVRLCLASVITFAERRIAFFESWRLTRGSFWNLVGTFLLSWLLGLLIMFAIVVVAGVLCLAILAPVFGSVFTSTPDYARALPFLIGAGFVGLIALIFIVSVQRVIMIAPLAYVYRALKGDQLSNGGPMNPSAAIGTTPNVLVL